MRKFAGRGRSPLPLFSLAVSSLLLVSLACLLNAEESCRRDPDDDSVSCEEGFDDEVHNVWKDEDESVEQEKNPVPLLSEGFDELEFELFIEFFSNLKDWKPTSASLSEYSPEELVSALMYTFSTFDSNDDGMLQYVKKILRLRYEELEKVLAERKAFEHLTKIKDIFANNGEQISIFEFFESFKKLGGGKDMVPLLTPFEKLRFMPPTAAKRIVLGSVQMFKDADEDRDGKLNKDEFTAGMIKSNEKRVDVEKKEISNEQIHGLFELIDKDKDEHLTYPEFQATMPEQRKSLEKTTEDVFQEADFDEDGELSEEEFKVHMTIRANKMKVTAPSEDQLAIAFEKLDKDGNGGLSLGEMKILFEEVASAQEKRMVEAFRSFDEDEDGFLSLEELERIIEGIEKTTGQKIEVKLFMSMLDANFDGKVSIEELQKTLTKMTPPDQ